MILKPQKFVILDPPLEKLFKEHYSTQNYSITQLIRWNDIFRDPESQNDGQQSDWFAVIVCPVFIGVTQTKEMGTKEIKVTKSTKKNTCLYKIKSGGKEKRSRWAQSFRAFDG